MLEQEQARLFVNRQILAGEPEEYLKKLGVEILPYGAFYDKGGRREGRKILLERDGVHAALLSRVSGKNRILDRINPTAQAKAVKHPLEIENMRRAHLKDGTALTRFIYWLKTEGVKSGADEISAAEKLEEFRREQEGYLGPSFDTISAYGVNAAMCHYAPQAEPKALLHAAGFHLVDSGGQYYEGTTDVTRTIVLGPLTDEQRMHFTLVLASMLRLGAAQFLSGCRGVTLDYAAREPLWNYGLDFNHGTGHGVGYFLNVHEGPQTIAKAVPDAHMAMEPGMVTSIEPGLYRPGRWGIRIQHLVPTVPAPAAECGEFLDLETLTLCPIETAWIDMALLREDERAWLNAYHATVRERLLPLVAGEARDWLLRRTEAVTKP